MISGSALAAPVSLGALVAKLEVWGHSYAAGSGANGAHGYAQKLVSTLKPTTSNLAGALGGAVAGWKHDGLGGTPPSGDNGYTWPLQNVVRPTYAAGAAQLNPFAVPQSALVLVDQGFNDLNPLGFIGGAGAKSPLIHALRVGMARYSAAAIAEETDASWVFGGAWSASGAATNENSGNGWNFATTPGQTATHTLPATFPGGTAHVGGFARTGFTGVITFTVDGVAAGTIDMATVAPVALTNTCGWVKRFTGLAAGAHTIVATTPTGTTTIDYGGIECLAAPVMVVQGIQIPVNLNPYNYGSVAALQADFKLANAMMMGLCSWVTSTPAGLAIPNPAGEFPNAIFVDPNSILGTNQQANFYAGDGLHPSDRGHSLLAAGTIQAIAAASVTALELLG